MTISARRILAVSPDPAVAAHLASALEAAGGDVAVAERFDPNATAVALCVLHVTPEVAAPLRITSPTVLVLPVADLAASVDYMLANELVIATLALDTLDAEQLTALARRFVDNDVLGLAKVVGSAVEIHEHVVTDHADKQKCMAAVANAVARSGVPARFAEAIEQCLDELLTNALYDAPVDAHGTHVFAGVSARDRIRLRTDQHVAVQYAWDGRRFMFAVRDAFGSLERALLLRYLHKCLHAEHTMDRKAGGAGVGLYLVLHSATAVYFHVSPRAATEAVAVFDTAASGKDPAHLGFIVQTAAAPALAARARVRPTAAVVRRRIVVAAVALLVAAGLGTFAIAAWPRTAASDAPVRVAIHTIPEDVTIAVDDRTVGVANAGMFVLEGLEAGRSYRVRGRRTGYDAVETSLRPRPGSNEVRLELRRLATLEIASEPSGSSVSIDGEVIGTTPLTVTTLQPGRRVAFAFELRGYERVAVPLEVPPAGEVVRHLQRLKRSAEFVRVRFESEPPGAEVLESGRTRGTDRTYTPAELFLEAEQVHRFTLTMSRHVPLVIEPFAPPRGSDGLVKGGTLVPGVALRIAAARAGTASVSGAAHCQAMAVPAECTLAAGTYTVEHRDAAGRTRSRTVTIGVDDVDVMFD